MLHLTEALFTNWGPFISFISRFVAGRTIRAERKQLVRVLKLGV